MAIFPDDPTPDEASRALTSIEQMHRFGLNKGLHTRRAAATWSLWAAAVAAATVYDGPLATWSVAILLLTGFLALGLWRRNLVARVRAVHSTAEVLTIVVAVPLAMLGFGLFAAWAFGASWQWWIPPVSGAVAGLALFAVLELLRRSTQRKVTGRLS
ncbi:MAG: hypothetical protein SYR96_25190 [Actinomycetota bacterium]|nr:hypothetical protein [Actinomycetota bacterium]